MQAPRAASVTGMAAVGAAVRALLADDSVLLREGLARVLTEAGFEVVAQLSDAQTLESAVAETRPSVAVLDVRMPGLDGVEVCERLRSAPGPATPVLLLSAFDDPALVARAHAAGADGFLAKGSLDHGDLRGPAARGRDRGRRALSERRRPPVG